MVHDVLKDELQSGVHALSILVIFFFFLLISRISWISVIKLE